MLAVGVLGFPYIGVLQTKTNKDALVQSTAVAAAVPGLVQDGKLQVLAEKKIYEVLSYEAIDDKKVEALTAALPEPQKGETLKQIGVIKEQSSRKALAYMAMFPAFMLLCYLLLIGYFKSKGGYKPVNLDASH
jgi:hypothetical protein